MPTAAELIRVARDELQESIGVKGHADSRQNAVVLANKYNLRLAEQSRPFRWVVGANNELKLEPFDETFAPGKPTPPIPPEAEIIKYSKAVQRHRDARQ